MSKHTCARCRAVFLYASGLKRHLARKTPCTNRRGRGVTGRGDRLRELSDAADARARRTAAQRYAAAVKASERSAWPVRRGAGDALTRGEPLNVIDMPEGTPVLQIDLRTHPNPVMRAAGAVQMLYARTLSARGAVLPLIFMLSPKAVFVPAKKITHPGHWLLDVTDASGLLKRVPLAVGRDRYTVSRELLYENDPSLRHYVSQHPEVEKKASPSAPMHMGGYAPVIQSGTWRLEAGGHRPVFVMNATYEPYTIWDYGDSGAYSLWQSRRAKRTVTALFES